MLWAFEHIRDRTLLDDAAFLHHCDAVGNVGDDAEIMGDEQHGHATPLLDVADQPENLRLRGDVERGGRFIRHQDRWFERQRHRYHGALTLTA